MRLAMFYGVINEFFFSKKKKEESKKEENIDYEKLVEDWIKNPKTIDIEGNFYCLEFYNTLKKKISVTKIKQLIKSNIKNFKKEKCNTSEEIWFTLEQQEAINKMCGDIDYLYGFVFDSDGGLWYCSEKNKIIQTDYKRVYDFA